MTELMSKLTSEAGLSADQAAKTIAVIKQFVTEKFPMLAGAVDNVLGGGQAAAPAAETGSWLDKISDVVPGELGEQIESLAKQAADKAEDLLEKGKDKFNELEGKL
jgi:hypothetical protein